MLFSGCFLDRSLIDEPSRRDAGARDAGARDASAPDASVDAGRDGSVDAGQDAARDAGHDGGPRCTTADDRCDGERAVTCTPSGLSVVDCPSRDAYCVVTIEGPTCEPWVCRPSSTTCSPDGTHVLTCDGRGTSRTETHCARGCASGACRPPSGCTRTIAGTLSYATTVSFSLCGGGDDDTYVAAADGCGDSFTASGEDRLLRLELDRRRVVRIEVTDIDPTRFVDPVVYVRRRCDDPATQLACEDDISASDRNARLTVELDAGEHFIVVDSFAYTRDGRTFGCGQVSVALTFF